MLIHLSEEKGEYYEKNLKDLKSMVVDHMTSLNLSVTFKLGWAVVMEFIDTVEAKNILSELEFNEKQKRKLFDCIKWIPEIIEKIEMSWEQFHKVGFVRWHRLSLKLKNDGWHSKNRLINYLAEDILSTLTEKHAENLVELLPFEVKEEYDVLKLERKEKAGMYFIFSVKMKK